MKASDSANSLSELVRDECFICLDGDTNRFGEPVVTSKLLRNCGCKFFVHPRCWNQWMKNKSDWDCPICHKQSVARIPIPPNPVLANVFIDDTRQRSRYRIPCAIFSLCVVIFSLGMIISSFINRS